VFDVGFAAGQRLDLGRVDVEADHAVASLSKAQHQRQADVAEADDADDCRFVLQLGDQGVFHGWVSRGGGKFQQLRVSLTRCISLA